jgi:hypothetical protein
MATFNQQNQTVGYQVNGENITVHQGNEREGLVRAIDALLGQIDTADTRRPEAERVIALLRQARDDAQEGDRHEVASRLQRAGEAAVPFAAIAASIAAMIQAMP